LNYLTQVPNLWVESFIVQCFTGFFVFN
jgi:hypothetical protein